MGGATRRQSSKAGAGGAGAADAAPGDKSDEEYFDANDAEDAVEPAVKRQCAEDENEGDTIMKDEDVDEMDADAGVDDERAPGGGRSGTARRSSKAKDEDKDGPMTRRRTPSRRAKKEAPTKRRSTTTKEEDVKCEEVPTKHKSKSSKLKLQAPHTFFENPDDEPVCALCKVPGRQKTCEGELVGPFMFDTKRNKNGIYLHVMCMTWSPEMYQEDTESGPGEWRGVKEGTRRALKTRCSLCNGYGASLGCMYKGVKCCKPMHFRCALMAGALLSMRPEFKVLCPTHKHKTELEPSVENQLIETPTPLHVLGPESAVICCDRDNFVLERDYLLKCGKCPARVHSKCLAEDLMHPIDWANMSEDGTFRCRKCMDCERCEQPLADIPEEELVTCTHCRHVTIHKSCVQDGADVSQGWRCKTCRYCFHCNVLVVMDEHWDEENRACRWCSDACRRGEVKCPTCCKVWRDDMMNVAMIMCDGCNQWIHSKPECSGVSEEEYKKLDGSKKKYYCPVCQKKREEKKRREAVLRASKRKQSRASVHVQSKSSKKKSKGDETIVVYASSDEEDGAYIRCVDRTTITGQRYTPEPSVAVEDLTPATDLCKTCLSSSHSVPLRHCINCGESYHSFCTGNNRLPELQAPNADVKTEVHGTYDRLTAGGTGDLARPWLCGQCMICQTCGDDCDEKDGQSMVLCDNCDRGTHLACADPPLKETPSGAFYCAHCRNCQLCDKVTQELTRIREHLFCSTCVPVVTDEAQPCVVCDTKYPYASRPSHLPVARCNSCTSIVRGECDASIVTTPSAFGEYKCPTCRPGEVEPACNVPNGVRCRPVSPAATVRVNGFTHADGNSKTKQAVQPNGHGQVAQQGPENHAVDMVDVIGHADMNGASVRDSMVVGEGDTNEKSIANGLKESVEEQVEELDISSQVKVDASDPLFWDVENVDNRVCELCKLPEVLGGSRVDLGRLLPLPPEGNGIGHLWIHAACSVYAVTGLLMPLGTDDGKDDERKHDCMVHTTLKSIKQTATLCKLCGMRGAAVKCCEPGCNKKYHVECAAQAGCKIDLNAKDESVSAMAHPTYCEQHSRDKPHLTPLKDPVKILNQCRQLRMVRVMKMRAPPPPPKADPFENEVKLKTANNKSKKFLVRCGALSVVHVGHLVPTTNDFIVDGALVPTGYRAVRRYWSMTRRGKRCLYYLEVRGDSSWGPEFAVWSEEDPDRCIKGMDVDAVWGQVRDAAVRAMGDSVKLPRVSGIAAFGLKRCRPVVTLIESLPLAWLFRKRYAFRYRRPQATHPELEERLIGSKGFQLAEIPVCKTGSSRTEGYVPKRKHHRHPEAAVIKKPESGALFQIGVAMEVEGFGEFSPNAGNPLLAAPEGPPPRAMQRFEQSAGKPEAVQYRLMQDRLGAMGMAGRKIAVLKSRIEGWGVFATRDINRGEMVIEYAGEKIRPTLSDLREKRYEAEYIGCYMFALTGAAKKGAAAGGAVMPIVDATMRGNEARYINHSCDTNCRAKEITNDKGERSICIWATSDIPRGVELTYNYMLSCTADEQMQLPCNCGSKKCKGFMDVLD